jgi:hypothetical protein
MARRLISTLVAFALLALGLVVVAPPAAAAVAPNGTYSNWTWPASATGYYNFDERLTVLGHTAGTNYFWAHQFQFIGGEAGYLGLQVGSYPNNSKIALFSVWGANGAQGANCGPFNQGGSGYTCRLDPYNWATGRAYRLRLWSVGEDSLGEWWGAWVQDTVTGTDSYVGKIRVPLAWGWLAASSVSWTQYFGASPSNCEALPWAKAQFGFPTANSAGVTISSHSHSISSQGNCPEYSRMSEVSGADVQEMGRAPTTVELLVPQLVRSHGAELRWTRFTGAPFDKYEVHRWNTAGFTPSSTTLLTTIRDRATTRWQDTTAAASTTVYYKVVANTAVSNEISAATPAAGRATLTLQPGVTEGKATYVAADRTSPVGCYDDNNYGVATILRLGTATNGVVHRPLLSFDLRDIPAGAAISAATLTLTSKTSVPSVPVSLHRLTRGWQEGRADYPGACNGSGASWKEALGGVRWTAAGGDVDAADVSTTTTAHAAGGSDSFNVLAMVQKWANGTAPNHGLLLRLGDESIPTADRYFDYHSDDSAYPTLRPKLVVTFVDNSAVYAPRVAVSSPDPDATVRGTAVPLTAAAADDRRVDKVDFLVDGSVVGSDTTEPYQATWNSTGLGNGPHVVTARAKDDAGNVVTSAGSDVEVDNTTAPSVTVTGPGANATVSGTVTMSATAGDDLGVTPWSSTPTASASRPTPSRLIRPPGTLSIRSWVPSTVQWC